MSAKIEEIAKTINDGKEKEITFHSLDKHSYPNITALLHKYRSFKTGAM